MALIQERFEKVKNRFAEKSQVALDNEKGLKQKLEEAKRIRQISKKNEKLKFRREVQLVKMNIERRDRIWLSEKHKIEDKTKTGGNI